MYSRQIYIFVKVVECGSFSKAAEKLFVTATSIMKQMNSLESRLNIKLFERTNQGIVLTRAGRFVYEEAKSFIQKSDEITAKARQIAENQVFEIKVGTSLLNPCNDFINLWNNISELNTLFKIKIVPFDDKHTDILSIINALGDKMDFIVGSCDSRQWLKRCSFFKLGDYKICCAVPRKHRLADKKRLKIEDLYGERLMMIKNGDCITLDNLHNMLNRKHPQINIVETSFFYDIDVFNDCVQNKNILLTLDAWKNVHPSLITVPVDWQYKVPYGLIYALNPSPAIKSFAEVIKNSIIDKNKEGK